MRTDVPHRYEGPEVLETLLTMAGCELTVEDVLFEFDAALEEDLDSSPAEIVPLFFESEPRFGSAEEAKRLYANLLGLWDQVKAKREGRLPVIGTDVPPPPPPEPEEGAAEGPEVPGDYVRWAWVTLTEGDEKTQHSWEDRFENTWGELADWLRDQLGESRPEVEDLALGLCVLTFAATWRAFGSRARAPGWAALSAGLEGVDEPQPTLAEWHQDSLEEAGGHGELEADEIERLLALMGAVRRALGTK